jgi:hypothetical protein
MGWRFRSRIAVALQCCAICGRCSSLNRWDLFEFRRSLRPGSRVAVSVNTVVERSYRHQIDAITARHIPGLAEALTRTFALGEASRVRFLFNEAGFADIETRTVRHAFVLSSFDVYDGPFERGGASTGQALAALPEGVRRAVREEVWRYIADDGGPIRGGGGVSDRQCAKVAG